MATREQKARRVHFSPSEEKGSRSALADETRLEMHLFDGEADVEGKPTVAALFRFVVPHMPERTAWICTALACCGPARQLRGYQHHEQWERASFRPSDGHRPLAPGKGCGYA